MAAAAGCLRAVGLQFWADSLQALPALLAPAVLLGLLLGAAAAALLCRCALGPRRGGEVRGAGGEGGAGPARPESSGDRSGFGLPGSEGRRAREAGSPAQDSSGRPGGEPRHRALCAGIEAGSP